MPASSSSTSSATSVESPSPSTSSLNAEQKDKLLALLKKEVKHIMEESVMLKSIHEESSTVTSLCAVVDACLSMGLKRRALGLFKTSSTVALMQKIAKDNPDADEVLKKVAAIESASNRRTHSSGDSSQRLSSGTLEKTNSATNLATVTRYLWIRIALFEKRLQKIVAFLVQESDKYYSRDSLLSDQDYGPIVSSLLVGPCALEYSKIRPNEQTWNELPANELVQRHRISSGSMGSLGSSTGSTSSFPATSHFGNGGPSSTKSGLLGRGSSGSPQHLQAKRSLSHTVRVISIDEARSVPSQAREYVESLHQNSKDSILFGKNNVMVQSKDMDAPQAGYLSLHAQSHANSGQQVATDLLLKWTPNKLMNGMTIEDKSKSWQSAVSIDLSVIAFIHCRQEKDGSGSLLMISNDGTQQPPVTFPPGGHLIQFLSCLESSLPKGGSLEPPVSAFEQALDDENKGEKAEQPKSRRQSVKEDEDENSSFGTRAWKILPLLKRRKENSESSEGSTKDCKSPTTLTIPCVSNGATDCVFKLSMPSSSGSLQHCATAPPPTQHSPMVNPFIASLRNSSGGFSPLSAPPDVMASSTISLPAPNQMKQARSDSWFANLFSPSKSRRGSTSTETSRSFSLSEYSGPSSINGGGNVGNEAKNGDEECISIEIGGELLPKLGPDEKGGSSPSEPISTLCQTMSKQIISRAFYGWLSHVRHLRTVRQYLSDLAFHDPLDINDIDDKQVNEGLTSELWKKLHLSLTQEATDLESDEARKSRIDKIARVVHLRIYFGGIEPSIRKEVWPYLLGHYKWDFQPEKIRETDKKTKSTYEHKVNDWMTIEAIVKQRDREITAANIARLSGLSADMSCQNSLSMSNEVFESVDDEPVSSRTVSADKISTITEMTENSTSTSEKARCKLLSTQSEPAHGSEPKEEFEEVISGGNGHSRNGVHYDTDGELSSTGDTNSLVATSLHQRSKKAKTKSVKRRDFTKKHKLIKRVEETEEDMVASVRGALSTKVTTPSVDSGNPETSSSFFDEDASANDTTGNGGLGRASGELRSLSNKIQNLSLNADDTLSSASTNHSPVSSEGGIFPQELIDNFALNMHRIDKDVQRCDRNVAYFTLPNLEKLRNIITTYVWENLDVGYMQGMCDLVAPLLVTFDDEAMTFSCFSNLMQRMLCNFPNGTQMDENFANMRALIQVLDQTLYDNIQQNGDFSHFYFCYRWFLLDFKREFTYNEIYLVWETIWASRHVASSHFYLFVAMALVENYRDIILDRNMDFTDIIKFFNEMAEKHQGVEILQIARDLVFQLQSFISDK